MKAAGLGVRRPLRDVVVNLNAPPRQRIDCLGTDSADVSVYELALGDRFVGAVAWASRTDCQLGYHGWPATSRESTALGDEGYEEEY